MDNQLRIGLAVIVVIGFVVFTGLGVLFAVTPRPDSLGRLTFVQAWTFAGIAGVGITLVFGWTLTVTWAVGNFLVLK